MLYLIRGLPGSGKSTLAKSLVASPDQHWEADMFFVQADGTYKYDPSKIKEAHKWCQKKVEQMMKTGQDVVVSNTFVRLWELSPYQRMAERYGYVTKIIECHANFGSVHNVPKRVIKRMKDQWENIL